MKSFQRTMTLFFFFAIMLDTGPLKAQDHFDGVPYFSYKRFLPAMVMLEGIPEKSGPQGELSKFAKDFSAGLYALTSEEYSLALQKLLRARRVWPEYFGTDFLIALAYEGRKDYHAAAGYYKGYLNKLKVFEAGEYPISGKVIYSVITSKADRYDIAHELIKDRLDIYGIDIDAVIAPLPQSPAITLFIIFILLSSMMYVMIHYFIAPHMERRKKMKALPEEYWLCGNCGTPNPNLVKECEECGKYRL